MEIPSSPVPSSCMSMMYVSICTVRHADRSVTYDMPSCSIDTSWSKPSYDHAFTMIYYEHRPDHSSHIILMESHSLSQVLDDPRSNIWVIMISRSVSGSIKYLSGIKK